MRNNKGFTLVELLVTMAIIAVILGMTVFGISLAQRASRDAQRRNTVDDINLGIQSYYELYNTYPPTNQLVFSANSLSINRNGTLFLAVPLNGITSWTGSNASGSTTSTGTKYCFLLTTGGYLLGAKLESGSWFEAGIDNSQSCTQFP